MKRIYNIDYPIVRDIRRLWDCSGIYPTTILYRDIADLTNFLRYYINVSTKSTKL